MIDGYLALDHNWLITFMNKQAERMLRLSSSDVTGTGLWEQFPAAIEPDVDYQLQLAMAGRHVSFVYGPSEINSWFEIGAHAIPNGAAVYFRDVTEQRSAVQEREKLLALSEQAKERLSFAVTHDALTNLSNRSALLSWIGASLDGLQVNEKVAVLFVDLDRFKRLNDTHGHSEGDNVLIQTAKKILAVVDPETTVARLGGDEFVIATHVNSADATQKIANRILSELARPIKVGERSLVVTASIGIAMSDELSTAENLLLDADVAPYEAKEQGRNRAKFFDNAVREAVVSRLDTEADLRDALRLDQISVYFQPIFSAHSKQLAGFETLMRWFLKEKGPISPDIFISVAEESGLVLPLGEYLIDATLDALPHLLNNVDDRESLTVWINVSSRQLEDYSFVNHLITSYQKNSKPGQLGIDLTESVLSKDSAETHSLLYAMAGRGIKVAIDDFGKGYSCLSRLVDYPVDLITLDRSLVEDMSSSSGSPLMPALINLTHAINATVCANGIETKEQMESLLRLNVDLVSEYYLRDPQPIERIGESISLGIDNLARFQQ